MQTSPGSSISCEHCGEVFQRKEHRDRHVLRHSGLRPFRCSNCNRAFPRRDTLLRHHATHHSHGGSEENARRAAQACTRCARLKQRRQGGHPCRRCMLQSSPCEYPLKTANKGEALVIPSNDTGGINTATHHQTNHSPSSVDHTGVTSGAEVLAPESWQLHSDMSLPSGPATGNLTETMPEFHGSLWDTDAWLAMSNFPSVFGVHDPTSDLFVTGNGGFPFLSTDTNLECSALSQVSTEAITHMSQPHQHTENAPAANDSLNESRVGGTLEETNTPASLSKYASDPASPLPRKDYPCFEFPEPSPEILQATRVKMFGHIGGISDHQLQSIHLFYQQQRACVSSPFISQEVLHAFVELYLEYFDPKFPFLHRSKLKGTGLEWVVLIAIAAVGSQYSMVPGSHDYGLVLQDLLGRALGDCASSKSKRTDIAFIQSLFLRHILLFFSGTKAYHATLQWERSFLVEALKTTAPRDDIGRRDCDQSDENEQEKWHAWVSAEEHTRIVHCAHALECLQYVFLDRTPLFSLPDLVAKLPCNEDEWLCETALEWQQALNRSTNPQPPLSQQSSRPTSFSTRTYPLEMYVQDRLQSDLLRSSKALQSMFTKQDMHSRGTLGSPEVSLEKPAFLDQVIDAQAYSQLVSRYERDLLVHVLAILRHVSLARLYQATGWQTNEAEMESSRTYLRQFLEQDKKAARRCLWHAAIVLTELRNAQHFACYDTLNMCVAVCFLWSFARLGPQTQDMTGQQKPAVRVDNLAHQGLISKWISEGDDADVYITGVGLLQGPESANILLSDAIKILSNQTTWSRLCHGLARAFTQLRNDEMINLDSE
ncbi:hypothetical protein BJ166DRAFT_531989 [Pestalotiopsis sp. NC0098]|nr:hypothetical protein BJ166DRAFT_531989 [Pestalotiopsis sp. NC0098]